MCGRNALALWPSPLCLQQRLRPGKHTICRRKWDLMRRICIGAGGGSPVAVCEGKSGQGHTLGAHACRATMGRPAIVPSAIAPASPPSQRLAGQSARACVECALGVHSSVRRNGAWRLAGMYLCVWCSLLVAGVGMISIWLLLSFYPAFFCNKLHLYSSPPAAPFAWVLVDSGGGALKQAHRLAASWHRAAIGHSCFPPRLKPLC